MFAAGGAMRSNMRLIRKMDDSAMRAVKVASGSRVVSRSKRKKHGIL
jgi:hypothetical protein